MNAPYSWQPLGALLVAKGLLTENQLQWALSEQQRSGRLVGEILVESGTISALDRKSTRLNSSHAGLSRMPSSA